MPLDSTNTYFFKGIKIRRWSMAEILKIGQLRDRLDEVRSVVTLYYGSYHDKHVPKLFILLARGFTRIKSRGMQALILLGKSLQFYWRLSVWYYPINFPNYNLNIQLELINFFFFNLGNYPSTFRGGKEGLINKGLMPINFWLNYINK